MVNISVKLGLICSILSFGFCLLCRYLIRPLLTIRQIPQAQFKHSRPYLQTCLTYSDAQQWERLNLLISWLHSLLTGLSVIYSFWAYAPEIYQDFVNHLTYFTYLTCAFSYGYFWYDLCDIISNRRGSDLWEMLLHHILTIIFFSFNIFRMKNIAYQMFALIAEISSIFLHARKLSYLYHFPRENSLVRLNTYLNLIVFFLCRLCMIVFVTIFVYRDGHRIGYYNYIYVMYVLMPVVWIINPILFYRVIYTDFIKKSKVR